MYETLHSDGKRRGKINYVVWSEVFSCNQCSAEVVFLKETLDPITKRLEDTITCPGCGAIATKEQMDLVFESFQDVPRGRVERRPKRVPVTINYSIDKKQLEKEPDAADLVLIEQVSSLGIPPDFPAVELPDCQMTRVGRMKTTNTVATQHMFMPRSAQVMTALWRSASEEPNERLRNMLLFFVEQAIWGISILNRYKPIQFGRPGGSQVNNYLSGVFYIGSSFTECSPQYILSGKLKRLAKSFAAMPSITTTALISTGDCSSVGLDADSVDYIFTDPPFGENIYYADLNFLVESWHDVTTCSDREAIVDRAKRKGTGEYQTLMRDCFEAYYKFLKPGRWMTVVFSNSKNHIWRAIQEAIGTAGFVVADVRTLDKQQGSFKQVTSSAVKQDLVISAYKPTRELQNRFEIGQSSADGAWAFVREHLHNVPVLLADLTKLRLWLSERLRCC